MTRTHKLADIESYRERFGELNILDGKVSDQIHPSAYLRLLMDISYIDDQLRNHQNPLTDEIIDELRDEQTK